MSDRLVGKWQVMDNATGSVLGTTQQKTILNVPYLTERGTYIRNGTEYTIAKQFRLVPGVYTRVTDDGNVEAQFNAKPLSGPSFRVYMEPATSHFYLRYRGRKIPLYPVLRAMGYSTEHMERLWGKEIAQKNRALEKSPYAVNFLRQFKGRSDLKEEIMQKVGRVVWEAAPYLKEAGHTKTMPVPENFDTVEELDRGRYRVQAGGNDCRS